VVRRRDIRGQVQAVLEQIAAEVATLPGPALRSLAPVLLQAEEEVARDLARWLRSVPDGEARFTAQAYRNALAQLRGAIRTARGLSPALFRALEQAHRTAGPLALGHLTREVERFSSLFEHSIRPIPIRAAAVLARGDALLIRHYQQSAAAYGKWATAEIERELAVGVVRGETFRQLTRRLQRIRPTARSVADMVTGPEQQAAHIAAGLRHRIQSRAELIVRTEAINAYNVTHLEALRQAAAEDPDYLARWDATLDRRGCELCRRLDGVTRGVGKEFPGGVKHPPRHPRCRCVLTPWHLAWGESPSSRPAPVAAPAPEVTTPRRPPVRAAAPPPPPAAPPTPPPPPAPPRPPRPRAPAGAGEPPDGGTWAQFEADTRRVLGRGLTEADVRAAFSPPDGYELRVMRLGRGEGGSAEMTGRLVTTDGKYVGDITRSFGRDAEGTWIKHELLWLEDQFQGKGIADHIMRNAYRQYEAWGVGRVKVYAVAVGRYTWARNGFSWASEKIAASVEAKLRDWLVAEGIADAAEAATIAAEQVPRPWILAKYTKDGRHLGKEFLQSRKMAGWEGKMRLSPDDEGYQNLKRKLGI
jgi:SPP1 gp7 family putative phage head morphogenesis protein